MAGANIIIAVGLLSGLFVFLIVHVANQYDKINYLERSLRKYDERILKLEAQGEKGD